MAGIQQEYAPEVEQRARQTLGKAGISGEVFVPRVTYRAWYSAAEALGLFRLGGATVVRGAEAAAEIPTPAVVFLLFVPPPSAALLAPLLTPWFEFWVWPERLQHEADEMGLPPAAQSHWSKDPLLASTAIVRAVRRLRAQGSAWRQVNDDILARKNAYRLPPINFHFPDQHSRLADNFRRLIRGERPQMPRPQRVGERAHPDKFLGNEHFRDAWGRFFPPGQEEHGALRELDSAQRSDDRLRHVWLNGAYRFGCWVGNQHEHYDVQRATGEVSPPPVYCARRDAWAHAAKPHANVFLNDCVRDNDLFMNTKTQG